MLKKKSITITAICLAFVLFTYAGYVYGVYTTGQAVKKQLEEFGWQASNVLKYSHEVRTASVEVSQRVEQLESRTASILAKVDEQPKQADASFGDGFRVGKFTVTAYSPYDNVNGINADATPDTTATGTTPRPGTIAVDPNVIPYGSEIVIYYEDGTIERGVAEDTGGWIDGNHIDVFRHTYDTAIKHGKPEAVVVWYDPNFSDQ